MIWLVCQYCQEFLDFRGTTNRHTSSVWKPAPPCCKKRAMASIDAPQMTDERMRRAPLLFCHVERQMLCSGSAGGAFPSSTRGASSVPLFEAILVMLYFRPGTTESRSRPVECQKRDRGEANIKRTNLEKKGQNNNVDTEKKKAAYTIIKCSSRKYQAHAKQSSDRAGAGGVRALVTKICTRHGWRNSTRVYAEGQADCAV